MKFVSTRDDTQQTTFEKALFAGLAPDGGLYVPTEFPHLPNDILHTTSLSALGYAILAAFLPEIPAADLQHIVTESLSFPIPLIALEKNIYVLEVFHGPTLAFKDVGARFMARMLAYFLQKQQRQLRILVATSGDTGSAIAHAFHGLAHIDVFILYPSGKVTLLQEKQMTTLGDNIHALEVQGTFDDCQRLVKMALLDTELQQHKTLTTANSINIARLLPQVIYHSFGITQLRQSGEMKTPYCAVPSGNFGNLTAALYAKKIGMPMQHFIAATNVNAIVPDYLRTGVYAPQPSRTSYSNAMDVGRPSNFERLVALFAGQHGMMRHDITGVSVSDQDTVKTIQAIYHRCGYVLDPHTAVGVAAAARAAPAALPVIVTATAHPAKFREVIQQALQIDIPLPDALATALAKPKQAESLAPDFTALKKRLLRE